MGWIGNFASKSTIGFVCPGSIWILRATRSRSHVVCSIHSDAPACILHRRESINHGKGIKRPLCISEPRNFHKLFHLPLSKHAPPSTSRQVHLSNHLSSFIVQFLLSKFLLCLLNFTVAISYLALAIKNYPFLPFPAAWSSYKRV